VEQKLLKLMAQLSFLALLIWVGAAALGKRSQLKVHKHPSDRKQDPNSPVWQHSGVKGPLASPTMATAIR